MEPDIFALTWQDIKRILTQERDRNLLLWQKQEFRNTRDAMALRRVYAERAFQTQYVAQLLGVHLDPPVKQEQEQEGHDHRHDEPDRPGLGDSPTE